MCFFLLCADDGDESFNDHEDGNGSKDHFREQDIYLPIANVARIMKNAVPQTGKVILVNFKIASKYGELVITTTKKLCSLLVRHFSYIECIYINPSLTYK